MKFSLNKKDILLLLFGITLLLIFITYYILYNIYIIDNIYYCNNKINDNQLILKEIEYRNKIICLKNSKEFNDLINLLNFLLNEYINENISKEEYFLIRNYFLKYNIDWEEIKEICNYRNMFKNNILFNIEFNNWLNEEHILNNFILNWKKWESYMTLLKNFTGLSCDYDTIIAIYKNLYLDKQRFIEYKDFKDFLLYVYIVETYYNENSLLNPAMIQCIILDTYKFKIWNIDPSFITEIYLKFQNKIKLNSLYSVDIYNNNIKECYNLNLEYWRKEMKLFVNEKILNRLKLYNNINAFKIEEIYIYPTDIIELYIKYFKDKIDEQTFIEILYYHIINWDLKNAPILEICYLINELPKDKFRENWTIYDYYDFYYYLKYCQWGPHLMFKEEIIKNIEYLQIKNIEETYILYKKMINWYKEYCDIKIYNKINRYLIKPKKWGVLGLNEEEKINKIIENIKKTNFNIKRYYNNKEWIYIKKLILKINKWKD